MDPAGSIVSLHTNTGYGWGVDFAFKPKSQIVESIVSFCTNHLLLIQGSRSMA